MTDIIAKTDRINTDVVAHARPPAKLNLFLEIISRRDDGYHEIDTVMVPINWCDEIRLARRAQPGIELAVDWLPSRNDVAAELGVDPQSPTADQLLTIPCDRSNLVYRALERFVDRFSIAGGFACELGKSIPAGAGMGGASSDAASALLCAAKLCGVDPRDRALREIAAQMGSDVPFFLGSDPSERADPSERDQPEEASIRAARATGRGERIEAVEMTGVLDFVVVFPPIAVSTPLVYAGCLIPQFPSSGRQMAEALENDDRPSIDASLLNRLTGPAKKVAPQISEVLEWMWRNGVRTCQLTGSGSACFAVVDSPAEAITIAKQIQTEMGGTERQASCVMKPGVRTRAAQSVSVPAAVGLTFPT